MWWNFKRGQIAFSVKAPAALKINSDTNSWSTKTNRTIIIACVCIAFFYTSKRGVRSQLIKSKLKKHFFIGAVCQLWCTLLMQSLLIGCLIFFFFSKFDVIVCDISCKWSEKVVHPVYQGVYLLNLCPGHININITTIVLKQKKAENC